MSLEEVSLLHHHLLQQKPDMPPLFKNGDITIKEEEETNSLGDQTEIKKFFPHLYGKKSIYFVRGENPNKDKQCNVAVILSGGQAPGGHNVIIGLFEALTQAGQNNKLFGIKGGPSGLVEGNYIEITKDIADKFRNTGGFDMIGSGRTKLETPEQFKEVRKVCHQLNINGIIIIGGDDSNTNAALLAEYFLKEKEDICVVGVPKTIDGDLKNEHIEVSFGFDTASKVYADLVGNIQRDANSAKKYWHFIKVMGRSASHLALEVALATHPNMTLISEETLHKKITLNDLVGQICELVIKRSEKGKNYGTILLSEGLVEFVPEIKELISELNIIIGDKEDEFKDLETLNDQIYFINKHLSKKNFEILSSFPKTIQKGLLSDRDEHGNISYSKIEIEKLLIKMASHKLKELKKQGKYKGIFSSQTHFLGYEGRCAFPGHFDSKYSYSLGYGAFFLLNFGLNGYMVTINNTTAPIEQWKIGGIPLTSMMNIEVRMGKDRPVIKKTLVDLEGRPFQELYRNRERWKYDDHYRYPGPIQYFGPKEVVEKINSTLLLERNQSIKQSNETL